MKLGEYGTISSILLIVVAVLTITSYGFNAYVPSIHSQGMVMLCFSVSMLLDKLGIYYAKKERENGDADELSLFSPVNILIALHLVVPTIVVMFIVYTIMTWKGGVTPFM